MVAICRVYVTVTEGDKSWQPSQCLSECDHNATLYFEGIGVPESDHAGSDGDIVSEDPTSDDDNETDSVDDPSIVHSTEHYISDGISSDEDDEISASGTEDT
ncbi:hypothetical protein A4X13_0g6852 [Tilletia indica]|uniref:Uncharacterized protein n=1 Tax=Tilletia indica TaxID=43049 RepID=A0A177TF31_9BASI|nr:hypothetical protein A4X13_0g6852 [Tilletia indica]